MKFLLISLLFFTSTAVVADAGSFVTQCENLAAGAKVRVVFEDKLLTRDDSQSLAHLQRLAPSGSSPYHSVLGLTHAEPTASLELTPRFLTDATGRVCAAPSLTLKLGFSTLKVYLARELAGACRRNIVDEHEQEHVFAWRSHFRAGARLLESLLQRSLARPSYYSHQAEAEVAVRQHVDSLISPLLESLKEGISVTHQGIDSPGSYQYAEGRMRACP